MELQCADSTAKQHIDTSISKQHVTVNIALELGSASTVSQATHRRCIRCVVCLLLEELVRVRWKGW